MIFIFRIFLRTQELFSLQKLKYIHFKIKMYIIIGFYTLRIFYVGTFISTFKLLIQLLYLYIEIMSEFS